MTDIANIGPFLRIAVLCEQAIEAKDGRLTIINIIDQVTNAATGPDVPDDMPPFVVQIKTVVALKAGQARGRFAIKLQPEDPSGIILPAVEIPVQFAGQADAGNNIILDLALQVEHEGLYWVDVFLGAAAGEERLLSRMPLRVIYQPQKTLPQGPPPGSTPT